jgi:hypothetical protein
MVAAVSNEELREWALELYQDEDLDEECQRVVDGISNIYEVPTVKEVFATCKQKGQGGSPFDIYVNAEPAGPNDDS